MFTKLHRIWAVKRKNFVLLLLKYNTTLNMVIEMFAKHRAHLGLGIRASSCISIIE